MAIARILNISYDASLLRTREELLKREGFEVMSVVGFEAALNASRSCQYDLAIIGHSIPREDKRKLAHEMKICDGHIRILSLRRHDTGPIPEADFSLEASEGPAALIDMVKKLLVSQHTSAQSCVQASRVLVFTLQFSMLWGILSRRLLRWPRLGALQPINVASMAN